MVTLEALNAEHGDCLLLHYILSDGGVAHRQIILIDGGPVGTWNKVLRPRLAELSGENELCIRLGIVTHIDEDHIGGIMKMTEHLLETGLPNIVFRDFWFNGYSHQPGEKVSMLQLATVQGKAALESVAQGGRLLTSLKQLAAAGKCGSLNADFTSGFAMVPRKVSLGVGSLEMFGPTQGQLDRLREEWAKKLKISVEALLVAEREDTSPTNLSSIAFLATVMGKSILFTGDALASDILEAYGDRPAQNIDVMKVPHHGASNNSVALFERFPAQHYVFCANGHHGHPSLTTLQWLLQTRGNPINLHLTTTRDNPAIAAQVEFMDAHWPGKVTFRAKDALSVHVQL